MISVYRKLLLFADRLQVVCVVSCGAFSVGLDYLACQQRVVTDMCGARTALWQRNITRLMLAAMPDDRSCFSYVFGQCCCCCCTCSFIASSFTLSLSFRLEIPRVRGQPHGFSVFTQLYSPRPSGRAVSPPCYTSRCRSTFFSVYPYSVVHVYLPPIFSWHNPPLLDVVHAQTISTWPPVPCPWCMLLRGCDWCQHSFSCLSIVRPRIHLSILISVLSKRSSSRLFSVHVSASSFTETG